MSEGNHFSFCAAGQLCNVFLFKVGGGEVELLVVFY